MAITRKSFAMTTAVKIIVSFLKSMIPKRAFYIKGPFIFYEGGGAGGIWEAPFKNRMTPPQLTNFFTWPPPL